MEVKGKVAQLLPLTNRNGKKRPLEKTGIYTGNSGTVSQKRFVFQSGVIRLINSIWLLEI